MRREGACAKRRRLAPTRGQAHGRMPPAGAYGEAGGPRRGDGGEKRCCCGYADATLCLFMLILPTAAVLLPITASLLLLHLRLFFVLPLRCRCIAVVLPLYCRCAAVALPLHCRCAAVVLPLRCLPYYLLRLSCTRFALPSLRGREWGSTRRTLAEMPSIVRMRCLILRSTSSIWRTSSEKSCWLIST